MSRLHRELIVDSEELDRLREPRDGLALERADGRDRFVATDGPFWHYERRLTVSDAPSDAPSDAVSDAVSDAPSDASARFAVSETIDYQLSVRYWRWLLALPVRQRLRTRESDQGQPAWGPTDRLDPRSAEVLSTLAVLAVVTGYLGTLIGQTMTFAAREFGAGDSAQADALSIIRIGAMVALGVLTIADRRGRRVVLIGATGLGIVATALGAIATGLGMLTLTQVVGRAFATTLVTLLPVAVAEEMPTRSRAYAVAMLAVSGAFGAGITIAALPLADLSEGGWRLIYLIPLLALPALVSVARRLPESRRFEEHRDDTAGSRELLGHRWRLVLLAATGFLVNMMVAPASQFRNELLSDEHGFSGTSIAVFVLITSAPAGVGGLIGGKLADRHGRRSLAGVGTVLSAAATAVFFLSGGLWLWALALTGTVIGAVAGPAVKVYEPEMFPTRIRSRATGIIGAITLVGSVAGLQLAGFLSDELGALGPAVALTAIGPIIAGLMILALYPETAGVELEELNPSDKRRPDPPEPIGGVDQE